MKGIEKRYEIRRKSLRFSCMRRHMMITQIKSIKNVGKYEMFCGSEQFEKNTIVFGFNGAGKSTLSDIFYSLMSKEKEGIIKYRKTLSRPNEHGEKEINIILSDDNGNDIVFSGETWNTVPNNLHVFNKYYIEDHVFISKHLQGDVVPIGMGSEGVKCMKNKEFLLNTNKELLNQINSDIIFLGNAGLKVKDFSNQRVTEKTREKRLESMASFVLYAISDKKNIEDKIKSNKKYTKELVDIEQCEKEYQQIRGIEQIDKSMMMKNVKRTLRISSKEITKFLSESLTVADIKWAISGYRNQKSKDVCPMCGQAIRDKRAIALFNKLGKYLTQQKEDYVREFCSKLHLLVGQLQMIDLSKRVEIFNKIIQLLNSDGLLLKKDTERLKKGLLWDKQKDNSLNRIIRKIYSKAENPYVEIVFSEEEIQCISLINKVIKNIYILGDIIGQAKERLEKKIDKRISMDDMSVLFELSYGPNRCVAERIKANTRTYLSNQKKIVELNEQIDDCYNQIQLDEINGYLEKLNTHIKIEVQRGRYYIRLRDFEAKEYEKGKEMLFSEGEERAVAFAYYLSEVNSISNLNEKNIVIIDDPICSMDLNRKSIISHQISEMMKNSLWQVIVMTHDISFVERIESFLVRGVSCKKLELRSEKNDFLPLNIKDYLTDDEHVYEELIRDAEKSDDELTRIIALMSLRPYAYVKKVSDEAYEKIQEKSTYFSHTLYSKKRGIEFKREDYDTEGLREYVDNVATLTRNCFDSNKIVSCYSFGGFDFNTISAMYSSIILDSMKNARKKVLLMRPLIEACFFQLSTREKFDPENIGSMYAKTVKANKNDVEKYNICKKLQEIYDSSKKYHHGADNGSLLGISWINPSEVEYYDQMLCEIILNIQEKYTIRGLTA